jgi:hypothetical protein
MERPRGVHGMLLGEGGGDTGSWGPIPLYLTRQRLPSLSQGSRMGGDAFSMYNMYCN